MTKRHTQKGFTIIEVVLVLAIAGLIFLVVFLALPQLQESRRDTQRRSDMGRLLAAMTTYAGSNNGRYPTTADDFDNLVRNYLPLDPEEDDFKYPGTGRRYDWSLQNVSQQPDQQGELFMYANARCEGDGAVRDDQNSARDVAVMVYLENGKYCLDNG